jgi:osmotically-inducible protein OsmY
MRLLLFAAVVGLAAYALRQPRRATGSRTAAVADDVLVTHVRLKLDELLEHPGSVNIEAHDGVVCLTGPVADRELRPLKRALRRMAGVRSLDCRLTPHAATA